MASEWNAVVPPRDEGEEDATKKQLEFIKQLFIAIGHEPFEFEEDDLGKWQASSLIDQLINIKENSISESPSPEQEERNVGLHLGFGILILPYVFSWLLLRKGYKLIPRVIAFSWLAFSISVFIK